MRYIGFGLALLGVAAGCGGQTAPGEGAGGGGGHAAADQAVVGIVSPAMTSMFHVNLVAGAKEEGEAYGWRIDSLAPDRETNFAAQVNLVESLVRRKVDAITICAINDTAIVGAIEQANKAGIPCFVHNSLTELPGGEVAAYIGYDQFKAGRLCGDYAVKRLKERHGSEKGAVYILQGVPGPHSNQRTAGFLKALEPYPEIEVAGKQPANWERQQGMNVAAAALKQTPALDLFFGCSDAMAQGAAQAAKEAGKNVFTIGIDGNPDALEDIKSGVLTATCAVYPAEMGRITMRTIKAKLDGETVGPKVETPIAIIDKGNLAGALEE